MLIFAHSVCWSAFRAGSLQSFIFRASTRSKTGFVVACTFGRYAAALRFAQQWAKRHGIAMHVKRARGGFSVSVPVSHAPTCQLLRNVSGLGVGGFHRLLVGGGILKGVC